MTGRSLPHTLHYARRALRLLPNENLDFFGPNTVADALQKDPSFKSAIYDFYRRYRTHGLLQMIGLPDLHRSSDNFTGSVSIFDHRLFPSLLGPDIHCGVQVVHTGFTAADFPWHGVVDHFKNSRIRMHDIERWCGTQSLGRDIYVPPVSAHVPRWEGQLDKSDRSTLKEKMFSEIGTIGGGNHFIEAAIAQANLTHLGITTGDVILLIHSGSRDVGIGVQNYLSSVTSDQGLGVGTKGFTQAIALMQFAGQYAFLNRAALGLRMHHAIAKASHRDVAFRMICDIPHDTISVDGQGLVYHRKGATYIPGIPSAYILPAQCTDGSILGIANGQMLAATQQSLCHGTGRSFSRSDAKELRELLLAIEAEKSQALGLITSYDPSSKVSELSGAYRDLDPTVNYLVEQGWLQDPIRLLPRLSIKD